MKDKITISKLPNRIFISINNNDQFYETAVRTDIIKNKKDKTDYLIYITKSTCRIQKFFDNLSIILEITYVNDKDKEKLKTKFTVNQIEKLLTEYAYPHCYKEIFDYQYNQGFKDGKQKLKMELQNLLQPNQEI